MKDLNRIHQLALVAGASVLAVVVFLVSPAVFEWGLIGRSIAAVLSVVGLDLLVNVIERGLAKRHTSKFLGDWFYISTGQRGEQDEGGGPVEHYAVANFSLSYPNLRYSVRIWDRKGIEAVLGDPNAGGHQIIGSAESSSVIYDGGDLLEVIYKYRPKGRDGLSGLLRITGVQGGEEMTGEWVTLWRNPGMGRLEMFRKERFIRHLEARAKLADGSDDHAP